MSAVTPEQCPRFVQCGANICPLDRGWKKRVHLRGERICGLLAESVKPGGEARLKAYLPAEQVEAVFGQREDIVFRWGGIKRRLARAATTGSELEAGQRMQATS